MDNNVSSTLPVPISVPRIVMVATYTQDTQTHSITASVSTQTDSNLLNTHVTTKQIKLHQRNEQTQTFPALTSISIQTDNTLTHNTSVTDVADDSSPELDNLEETQQLPRDNSSRKRKKPWQFQINKNKRRKSGLVKINKTSQKLQQTPSQDLRVQ